jgi:hypothetical protein
MSLLFEAVFEQLQVELGAVKRDSKVVGYPARATIDAHQQSQKCKARCDGGHHQCRLLE